jgi:hypothetical protein
MLHKGSAGPQSSFSRAWGAETGLCGGSEFVFVDETAEEVAPVHAGQQRRRVASSRSDGGSRIGRLEVDSACAWGSQFGQVFESVGFAARSSL